MTTFNIKSLGCRVSQYDGDRLAEKLLSLGIERNEVSPEIFIVNGCSVTGRAAQKAHQLIRSIKRNNPEVKVVLAGCEARRIKKTGEVIPELDWLLPQNDEENINQMISALSLDIRPVNHAIRVAHVSEKTRAYLKIQDGCSQFCSYCLTSRLRGPEWSRDINDAVKEAEELANDGHKEIVLSGIHLGHFKPSLVPLLEKLEKIDKIERIRLGSIESVEVHDDLIEFIANSSKCCHNFHLPLQSGSDSILKAMRRPYSTDEFYAVVSKIRKKLPNAAITTDLMVGFPGETEELFNETLEFLHKVKFSRMHIFKFSPREGTPAATMPNQIDNATKAKRSDMVETIWKKYAKEFHEKFIGKELQVLWETYEDGYLTGFSREYVPCIKSVKNNDLENTLEKVIGINADLEHLYVKNQ